MFATGAVAATEQLGVNVESAIEYVLCPQKGGRGVAYRRVSAVSLGPITASHPWLLGSRQTRIRWLRFIPPLTLGLHPAEKPRQWNELDLSSPPPNQFSRRMGGAAIPVTHITGMAPHLRECHRKRNDANEMLLRPPLFSWHMWATSDVMFLPLRSALPGPANILPESAAHFWPLWVIPS